MTNEFEPDLLQITRPMEEQYPIVEKLAPGLSDDAKHALASHKALGILVNHCNTAALESESNLEARKYVQYAAGLRQIRTDLEEEPIFNEIRNYNQRNNEKGMYIY